MTKKRSILILFSELHLSFQNGHFIVIHIKLKCCAHCKPDLIPLPLLQKGHKS
jgi:hypothetical protein